MQLEIIYLMNAFRKQVQKIKGKYFVSFICIFLQHVYKIIMKTKPHRKYITTAEA